MTKIREFFAKIWTWFKEKIWATKAGKIVVVVLLAALLVLISGGIAFRIGYAVEQKKLDAVASELSDKQAELAKATTEIDALNKEIKRMKKNRFCK